MRRPVLVVLVLTFVALVAATLWVPVMGPGAAKVDEYAWAWAIPASHHFRVTNEWLDLRLGQLLFNLSLILALGGLLALVLHLRARRVASDAS